MKLRTEYNDEDNELSIYIDDKLAFNVHDGEPEDNCLLRNFSDCYVVANLIRFAFLAGQRGEELIEE